MDPKLQQKILRCLNSPPRLHNRTYEKRALINGISLYACASSAEECTMKFLDEISQKIIQPTILPKGQQKLVRNLPTNFHEFAMFYFENVKKRLVVEKTFYGDMNRYKNHVRPRFGHLQLKSITVEYCQACIDELAATGKGKTTDEVHSMLNGIFDYAVDRGLIPRSPMKPVVHIPHETVSGHPLTMGEEEILFNATYGTEYQTMFAIILYTGMRPNEIRTATLVDNMIIAKNSKRKDAKRGKISWKRIPVCPNLVPFLVGISEIDMYSEETMRDKLKTIFPHHTLKDLRKTFYTRLETYKVDDKVRDACVGHSQGKRHDAYSELPDEFLIEELKKVSYPLNVQVAPKSAPKKNRYALAEKLGKPKIPRFTPQKP